MRVLCGIELDIGLEMFLLELCPQRSEKPSKPKHVVFGPFDKLEIEWLAGKRRMRRSESLKHQ
jgi:hypothetical protein